MHIPSRHRTLPKPFCIWRGNVRHNFMDKYFYTDNLQSDRLFTRYLTSADTLAWTTFFEDKEAVEFLPNFGLDTENERAQHWINRTLNRYAEGTYGLQALFDKKTNEFIGQCGLLTQTVDDIKELEVGYHMFKKYWGQGYAPEAAKLFIDFAFKNNLADSIISIINTGNLKSQRVADKNGLIKDKQTRWNNLDVFIYRINK